MPFTIHHFVFLIPGPPYDFIASREEKRVEEVRYVGVSQRLLIQVSVRRGRFVWSVKLGCQSRDSIRKALQNKVKRM